MELWASLWPALGIEESRAKATALEFLLDCQALGQTPTFIALMRGVRVILEVERMTTD